MAWSGWWPSVMGDTKVYSLSSNYVKNMFKIIILLELQVLLLTTSMSMHSKIHPF